MRNVPEREIAEETCINGMYESTNDNDKFCVQTEM